MDNRNDHEKLLAKLENELKQLQIKYEQYFAGVEKREPVKDRELIGRLLRKMATRHITQTDVRFRFQNLATRFHSYNGYWERVLRLMDEGRYHRGGTPPPSAPSAATAPKGSPVDTIYDNLVKAHTDCGLAGKPPEKGQVEKFLASQRQKIREKFGDKQVDFFVVTENGRPKIKARAKKGG
ncbi:MAG: hypothetical protein C0616_04015 [Desulfuromonas sp.]|nr:MAG: hypothetical protein C0616_04015 [Desulfuromonas sp.]